MGEGLASTAGQNQSFLSGGYDHLQEQIASIVDKIGKMPLDAIGRHLDDTLVDLDRTLKLVNSKVLPEAAQTMQQATRAFGSAQTMMASDAPLQQNLGQTLQQVQRAARSLRALTDLLSRHPEALLRGMPDGAPPPTSAGRAAAESTDASR